MKAIYPLHPGSCSSGVACLTALCILWLTWLSEAPLLAALLFAGAAGATALAESSAAARVSTREYPSVFQAWNPIDMPREFAQSDNEGRLRAAAKHDVLWEEPVSQLGMGVKLVLGAQWDGPHGGNATRFTPGSLKQALANRRRMLALNPHMVLLMEVRWRDAPNSFLPEDSPFWKRKDGKRVLGWDGGPEPYYLLDYENPEFFANIARQSKYAIESGVYDGVMFDWRGYLPIIKKVREVIGKAGLIIVNIHDLVPKGEEYEAYINGAFMECNPAGLNTSPVHGTWEGLGQGLLYFEAHFQEPRLNCVEVMGDRRNLRRMRAATTFTLTHSNGSVLYGDLNELPTPDHLHDWYPFWDVKIGRPVGQRIDRPDGAYQREFQRATVIYNPLGNQVVTVTFPEPRRRVSDRTEGASFQVGAEDGDMFLRATPSKAAP